MPRHLAAPAAALALLALAGCASTLSTRVDRSLAAIPAGSGVAVFSTGSAVTASSGVTRLSVRTPSTPFFVSGERTDALLDGATDPSDFPGEHGRVRALVLPEGTYCLAQVGAEPDQLVAGEQAIFRVGGGELTYLGNLFLTAKRVEVRDRAERDLAVFRERNPGLAGVPAVTALATLARSCGRSPEDPTPAPSEPAPPSDPRDWPGQFSR